jgi:antitoxin component YwqK of YwqJK toxin-antitoxin module
VDDGCQRLLPVALLAAAAWSACALGGPGVFVRPEIQGRLVDATTGEPIADAMIFVEHPVTDLSARGLNHSFSAGATGGAWAATDRDGRFRLPRALVRSAPDPSLGVSVAPTLVVLHPDFKDPYALLPDHTGSWDEVSLEALPDPKRRRRFDRERGRTHSDLCHRVHDVRSFERCQALVLRGWTERPAPEDGPWELRDARGALLQSGAHRGGQRDGPWMFRYEDGSVALEAHYRDGIRHGAWAWLDRDGHVRARGEYRQGRRTGDWTETEDVFGVRTRWEGSYVDGEREGTWVQRRVDGRMLKRVGHRRGRLDGPHIQYGLGGLPAREVRYRDGELHGPARDFSRDGALRRRGTYRDGRKDGEWRFHHEDGQVSCRAVYEQGVLRFQERWDPEGQLLCRTPWNRELPGGASSELPACPRSECW